MDVTQQDIIQWQMVLSKLAGERWATPSNPNATCHTKRVFTRPNGSKFYVEPLHRLLWSTLVVNARDLSVSPTHTLISHEKMAQMCGVSSRTVSSILNDLAGLGLVHRQRRLDRTNKTNIFFTPFEEGALLPGVSTPITFTHDSFARTYANKVSDASQAAAPYAQA